MNAILLESDIIIIIIIIDLLNLAKSVWEVPEAFFLEVKRQNVKSITHPHVVPRL